MTWRAARTGRCRSIWRWAPASRARWWSRAHVALLNFRYDHFFFLEKILYVHISLDVREAKIQIIYISSFGGFRRKILSLCSQMFNSAYFFCCHTRHTADILTHPKPVVYAEKRAGAAAGTGGGARAGRNRPPPAKRAAGPPLHGHVRQRYAHLTTFHFSMWPLSLSFLVPCVLSFSCLFFSLFSCLVLCYVSLCF